MTTTASKTTLTIEPFGTQEAAVWVIGDSPLIVHAWSEKAKKAMLDKQMKKAVKGKEAKNPQQDYEESLYYISKKPLVYGFPAVAFKAAAVRAGKNMGIPMTDSRTAFHVDTEMVVIHGKPAMREDTVRLNGGVADIRYRGEFKEWHAMLPLKFNPNILSLEQLISLLNAAGFGVGVGEWRPEKDGQFGRFHVACEDEMRKIVEGKK